MCIVGTRVLDVTLSTSVADYELFQSSRCDVKTRALNLAFGIKSKSIVSKAKVAQKDRALGHLNNPILALIHLEQRNGVIVPFPSMWPILTAITWGSYVKHGCELN